MKTKFVLLLLFTLFFSTNIYAQAVNVVRDFGENMNMWTVTHDDFYRIHVENLCDPSFRAYDKIAEKIAEEFNQEINEKIAGGIISMEDSLRLPSTLMLDSYLNFFEINDSIVVKFADYSIVDKKDIKCKTKSAMERVNDDSREYVICKISISTLGNVHHSEWCLISVRNNKILGIMNLEKKRNKVFLR